MLYQLPDGRTVEISLEDYLSFSDADLDALIGLNYGVEINNPMYGSSTKITTRPKKQIDSEEPFQKKEIPDVSASEKLNDQDYVPDEE